MKIRIAIIACPNIDHVSAVTSEVSPVSEKAEAEVKSASSKLTCTPVFCANGAIKKPVPAKVMIR